MSYKMGEVVELKVGRSKFEVTILDEGPVEIQNPYSGATCKLEPLAIGVYDLIKGAEMLGDYKTLRMTLDYFRKHWSAEYMTLLD